MVNEAGTLQGGCHCGAVRYEVSGRPYHATLCHCTDCRRTSGSPAMAWFSVKPGEYRIVQGMPQRYRSSGRAWRSFCGACGTQLSYEADGLGEVDVATGSLDDPGRVPPQDQTFARSRLPWVEGLHTLPSHATTRPG